MYTAGSTMCLAKTFQSGTHINDTFLAPLYRVRMLFHPLDV